MSGSSQVASSRLTNMLKNIMSSRSMSYIKNASLTKLQVIYKTDGKEHSKELTDEQLKSVHS